MGDRILVAYSSRRGSTREIADAIATVFQEAGAAVDVRPVEGLNDLTPYRAVLVGSGVRRNRFQPEAVAFVTRCREALSRMPVAYFAVCGLLKKDTAWTRNVASHFCDRPMQVAPEVVPMAKIAFAGKYEAPAMCPFMRLICKWGLFPSGDWRDWRSIRTWAESLLPYIGPAA